MKNLQNQVCLYVSAAFILATLSCQVQADIMIPNGLSDGDVFRLVFVTSSVRDATSTNIADYDAFIASAASSAGLTTYNGNAVSWHVIGSTATVDVRNRDTESPAGIFRVDGTKVGADLSSLLANKAIGISLLEPINVDENGNGRMVRVYTGTSSESISYPSGVLGASNGSVFVGYSGATDSTWLQESRWSQNASQFSMYGISEVLVVQSVPEPSSFAFLSTLAAIAFGLRLRRGRSIVMDCIIMHPRKTGPSLQAVDRNPTITTAPKSKSKNSLT